MNDAAAVFESNHKKLSLISFNSGTINLINEGALQYYIKVLFVPAGYTLTVDFNRYETQQATLFFVNSNQYLQVDVASKEDAFLINYNRDFYCIQIHDEEVACDGLLFNNIFEIPKVDLFTAELDVITMLFKQVRDELSFQDNSSEEMIRIYLKQIIIRATRIWKKQNLENEKVHMQGVDQDFLRNFGRLVDIHYREKHAVADYAAMLHLAPKTLTQKFHKLNLESPNEFIKNRIILEAKRLLLYTGLSIKEIAFKLGYDDPAYFNRLFTQKCLTSPASFRKKISE